MLPHRRLLSSLQNSSIFMLRRREKFIGGKDLFTSELFKNILTNQRRWAGHNKWSKIKHKKGAKDLNRAKVFARATKAIRAASRACNGDLSNLHLQSTIQAAKAIQVSKDRIEDAISNSSKFSEAELVTQRYDGYINTSSGKVAVIAVALTNNKNRTAANIRSKMSKANGELLNTGANDWMFDHVGVALVHKHKGFDPSFSENQEDSASSANAFKGITVEEEERIMECALEGGAIDVDFGDDNDEHVLLKSEPTDLHPLVLAMRNDGYTLSEFEWRYLVKDDGIGNVGTIQLDSESTESFESFLEKLDDDDDISEVHHNASLLEAYDEN
mmetsp:Transcript_3526/g.4681  ORF Transcript_3526/g.4681 Transcript_3526/m.4681 type:complete len:329 (-) Transcript_3526:17-1003(-)